LERVAFAVVGPQIHLRLCRHFVDVDLALQNGPLVDGMMRYRASKVGPRRLCAEARCRPKAPARKATRPHAVSERRRSRCWRISKCVLKHDRLRSREPFGARDAFHLAAIAQNLRKLAKICTPETPNTSFSRRSALLEPMRESPADAMATSNADFFATIEPNRLSETSHHAGLIFWLTRKKLVGSYLPFKETRRS
jgi:hypothetical protein